MNDITPVGWLSRLAVVHLTSLVSRQSSRASSQLRTTTI
jgi:hypothetical protein